MAKDKLQEVARILYLQGFNQKDIAAKIDVSEPTICKWKIKGNWNELKTNLLNSKQERLVELYNELAEFNRMIKERDGYKVTNSKEADARRKLIKDIAELERKYNIGQTIQIGKDFVLFIKEVDYDFSKKALTYFDSFINHLIEKQKWQG